MRTKTIVWLIIIVLVLLFIVGNSIGDENTMSIWYFKNFDEVPKILVILITLAIGFIAGYITSNRIHRKTAGKKNTDTT